MDQLDRWPPEGQNRLLKRLIAKIVLHIELWAALRSKPASHLAGESARNGKRHRLGGVFVCLLCFYFSGVGGIKWQNYLAGFGFGTP
jgi:hypothetical protein